MANISRIKLAAVAVGVLIVALGLGFAWGASGRFEIETVLEDVRQELDLAEARGSLLDARVSLYNVNFGDASRHFQEAKAPLRRAQDRYQRMGENAAAGSIAAALAHVEEGQRLASALDQGANAQAIEALEAIRVATSR